MKINIANNSINYLCWASPHSASCPGHFTDLWSRFHLPGTWLGWVCERGRKGLQGAAVRARVGHWATPPPVDSLVWQCGLTAAGPGV